MDSFYTSAEEIEILAGAFNSKTLPKDRWTHAAHLTIAVWYLKKYLFHEALNLVRKGITEYNVAVGTQNTTTGGYHDIIFSDAFSHQVKSFMKQVFFQDDSDRFFYQEE